MPYSPSTYRTLWFNIVLFRRPGALTWGLLFNYTPSNEHGLIKWKQFRGTIVVDMGLKGILGLVGNWSFAVEHWTRILVLR